MTRLLRSELLRARSRRLLWAIVIGAAIGVATGVTIAAVRSSPPTPAELAAAERASARDMRMCLSGGFGPTPDAPPAGYASLEEFCEEAVGPSTSSGSELIRLDDLPEILEGASLITVLLGVVVGASLGGADWSAGSMATLLTWESRRTRVLVVRATVAAAVVLAIALFLQTVFTVGWTAATSARGLTTTGGGFLSETVGAVLRISAVAAVFGVVAFALANLGRSTAAAVGILLGYLVVVEGFLAGMWSGLVPWLLVRAATAVVAQVPIVDPQAQATYGPDGRLIEVGGAGVLLSVPGAWVLLAAYAIVLVAAAVALFRLRDVA